MKPTKFELMRANRAMADLIASGRPRITQEQIDAVAHGFGAAPAQLVPYMEIDGVRYVEELQKPFVGCHGCHFERKSSFECIRAQERGSARFGAYCTERHVIYIKAA